jgi:hypothetical protein
MRYAYWFNQRWRKYGSLRDHIQGRVTSFPIGGRVGVYKAMVTTPPERPPHPTLTLTQAKFDAVFVTRIETSVI